MIYDVKSFVKEMPLSQSPLQNQKPRSNKIKQRRLQLIQFGKDWVQGPFGRIGFKKQVAITGKVTVPKVAWKGAD